MNKCFVRHRNRDEEQLFSTHKVPTGKSYKTATLHLGLMLVKHCQAEAIEGVARCGWTPKQFLLQKNYVRGGAASVPFWVTGSTAVPLAHHPEVRLPEFEFWLH